MDDAGEDQGQAGAGIHLVVDLAGPDAPALTVIHGTGQGVELFDLEQAPAHPGTQLRLGHVLQEELSLQDTSELTVGGVEAVRCLEAVESLQCGRRGGWPAGKAA